MKKAVYKGHIAAIILMAVLALIMSYPVVTSMQDSIAGQGGDPWQAMWRLTVKANGGIGAFVHDVTGSGEARLSNLSVWPWIWLHMIAGEPAAYNGIWLLTLILSGYAMAIFVQMLTRQSSIFSPAPLLAGIAFMFLPYRSAHALGHFGAMQVQWIPFLCAAVLSYVRNPRWWKALLAAVLFAIQAWTEHHYALWLALFAIIAMLVYRTEIRSRIASNRNIYVFHGLIFLFVILIGVVLPYIPTIRLAATNEEALELGVEQTSRFSADLFSFITPSAQHPLWGGFFDSLFGQYFTGNSAESVQYLGLSILLVVLFFHRHIPIRQKRLWIATIIVFGLISLGPVLHLFGKETSIPLPYALIDSLPVFSAIRVVARAGVMVGFAVCTLFGWALATNSHRLRTSIVAGAVILLEFLFVPFPLQSAQLSPAYSFLSTLPGQRTIEIPAATNYTAASRSLYASIIHNKESVGNIALERGASQEIYEHSRSLPAIRQLLYVRSATLSQERDEFFQQDLQETLLDAMRWIDAASIVVHTDSLSAEQNAAVSRFLSSLESLQVHSFQDVDVYAFSNIPNTSDGVLLARGGGWEDVRYDGTRKMSFAEVSGTAYATVVNMNEHPVTVEFAYTIDEESEGTLEAPHNIEVPPGEVRIEFRHVGPGTSILQNPIMRVGGAV